MGASVREAARILLDAEMPLVEGYKALRAGAVGRAEQALAQAVSEAQKAQVSYLELLCEDLPPQFLGVGSIGSDAVKMREGAGGGFAQIGELRAGTPVIVMEWNGYWAAIQIPGGRRGFVFRDYIRTEAGARDAVAWQR